MRDEIKFCESISLVLLVITRVETLKSINFMRLMLSVHNLKRNNTYLSNEIFGSTKFEVFRLFLRKRENFSDI